MGTHITVNMGKCIYRIVTREPYSPQTRGDNNDEDLSVINLTPYPLSEDELTVLKLGLSFCPNANLDKYEVIKDLYLFARKLTYKHIFDPDKNRPMAEKDLSEQIKKITMKDFRALKDLMILLDENQEYDDTQQSQLSQILIPNTQGSTFKNKSDSVPRS